MSDGGRAIVAGAPSSDDAVVAIGHGSCDDAVPIGFVCTGVLIAPRVVVTAAHCLGDAPDLDGLSVLFGATVSAPTARRTVIDARIDPGYDPTQHVHDLALLVIGADAPVAPLPRASVAGVPAGSPARLVGFGADRLGGSPGTRQTGDAQIIAVDDATVTLAPDPSLSCNGDSGGAVLVAIDGIEQLVAVIRSGDAACARYTIATRLDVEAGFIEPYVAAADDVAADAGRCGDGGCAAGAPDGGLVAIAIALAACAVPARVRRPRHRSRT